MQGQRSQFTGVVLKEFKGKFFWELELVYSEIAVTSRVGKRKFPGLT